MSAVVKAPEALADVGADVEELGAEAGAGAAALAEACAKAEAEWGRARQVALGKLRVAFAHAIKELRRLQEELAETRSFLLREEDSAGFANHVALVLQYVAMVLREDGHEARTHSATRIKSSMYQARYDGVRLGGVVARLRGAGHRHWRIRGDLTVLGSRLHGLNEVLHMIYSGRSCPVDDHAICIATGRAEELNEAYAETVTGLYDAGKASRNLERFLGTLMIANASLRGVTRRKTLSGRSGILVRHGVYYGFLFRGRGRHRGEMCYAGSTDSVMEETLPFAKFMWNLPDRNAVRLYYRMGLPWVRCSTPFTFGEGLRARFIAHAPVGVAPPRLDGKRAAKAVPQRALILHMHGGGFISMSASAHENYTRVWARQTGCPIVSLDYSLAPEHPFPAAVNEAFEAYRWCCEIAAPVYGTSKVILAGDSAGGTLCAAVAIRCINDGYRVPHGMLLAYPAMDIRRVFTPSLLWTVNDQMLPYLFLQGCLSAYIGTSDEAELVRACRNPLVSPSAASDDVVARFPRCHFVAASRDPLYDTTLDFCERMHRLTQPGTVTLSVVPDMVHGFLSLNWPLVGVPQVSKLIEQCGTYLERLISSEELPPRRPMRPRDSSTLVNL